MFFDYTEPTLTIGNRKSVLKADSLLLGTSSKSNDDTTIGKFGEGYKIATLVLLRLGYKIVFYNYGAREVWLPRFVKSRRYGADILTFFVDNKHFWEKVPDNNLTIKVEGITPKLYKEIVASNLHLQVAQSNAIHTEFGRILPNHKGKVFVNGLFVSNYEPYHYGYDFKPQYLNIDRDRKLVSDFDLKWLASKMWSSIGDERIVDLAKIGAADVRYINSHLWSAENNAKKAITDKAYNDFISKHGKNALPITDQFGLQNVPQGYKAIIVQHAFKELITASTQFIEPIVKEKKAISQRLEDWFESVEPDSIFTLEQIYEFKDIMRDLKSQE